MRKRQMLELADRMVIESRLGEGCGIKAIAAELVRDRTAIHREVARHSEAGAYVAGRADRKAGRDRRLHRRPPALPHDSEDYAKVDRLIRRT